MKQPVSVPSAVRLPKLFVATAFGIAVAVPAVLLFNYFTNKVTSFSVEMENSASELVDYFIKQRTKQLKGQLI